MIKVDVLIQVLSSTMRQYVQNYFGNHTFLLYLLLCLAPCLVFCHWEACTADSWTEEWGTGKRQLIQLQLTLWCAKRRVCTPLMFPVSPTVLCLIAVTWRADCMLKQLWDHIYISSGVSCTSQYPPHRHSAWAKAIDSKQYL